MKVTPIDTVKDIEVFVRELDNGKPPAVCIHDNYNRHTPTLSLDEARALARAINAGADYVADHTKESQKK